MLTIVTPASNRKLTTLSIVKTELNIATQSADNAFIESLIDQASAAIETWCGRTFPVDQVRETIDGRSRHCLILSRFPITEIISANAAGNNLDVSTIEIEDGGIMYRTVNGARTSWPAGRTVIEFKTGYNLPGDNGTTTLPADITRAANIVVRQAYLSRTRDPQIRSEETFGVGNTTYVLPSLDGGHDLPPEVEGLLVRYQISEAF